MQEQSGLYYPNRFARLILLAVEDVMGLHGLNTLLTMADLETYVDNLPPADLKRQFDFAYLAAISESLEDMYGPRGGRGIALRIGRAAFSRGMKNFGALAGMGDPAFRALSLEKRTRLGLDALVAVFSQFTDQHSSLQEKNDHYLFIAEVSPFAWGRTAERPVCHALAGIVQEGLRWASNGYVYHVQEVECRAAGSEHDVFKINKMPIGEENRG